MNIFITMNAMIVYLCENSIVVIFCLLWNFHDTSNSVMGTAFRCIEAIFGNREGMSLWEGWCLSSQWMNGMQISSTATPQITHNCRLHVYVLSCHCIYLHIVDSNLPSSFYPSEECHDSQTISLLQLLNLEGLAHQHEMQQAVSKLE